MKTPYTIFKGDIEIKMTPEQYDKFEIAIENLSLKMGTNIHIIDINTDNLIMLVGGRA